MTRIDLDDTTNCPLGHRCESCGTAGGASGSTDPEVLGRGQGLVVETATTPVGVLCLTLCPRCAASSVAPPVPVATAVRLVIQHCMHLGIDADEMAAAMNEAGGR